MTNSNGVPAVGIIIDPDDVIEFHAARLLLLLRICGTKSNNSIKGRTKLAKLDFFLRYPHYLELGLVRLRNEGRTDIQFSSGQEGIESRMIRYKFGPWDHRYFSLLPWMLARDLLRITNDDNGVESFALTSQGKVSADLLRQSIAFEPIVYRCGVIKEAFGKLSGTTIKSFIYETFTQEIVELPLGKEIQDVQRQF